MSLNRTPGLQLFQGELTVQHHKDVQIVFKKTKYSCEHLKGTKVGQLYLTNFRMFFVNQKKNDMLQTLSVPFKLIKDFEIKQPTFGANYLEGKILAEEGGGWQGSAQFEITFKAGGAIEVGESLVKLAKSPRMMYVAQPTIVMTGVPPSVYPPQQPAYLPQQPAYAPPPQQPAYAPPPAGYYPVAPPMYTPPQQQYPQNPAYPPYPPQPHPQQVPMDPKAQEAMGSNLPPGYSAPVQNPPPYGYDTDKKNQ